ncbi:MAG: hypothetical protein WBP40_01425 [Candidatus Moraniibacteriota bacterium]
MHQKPLFLTIILITLLAVIAGAFWCLQNRPGAMNQPIVTEPVAQAPIQAETEKYPQHIETIPGNADEVWYNIPEMGIQMRMTKDLANDLVYECVALRDEDLEDDDCGLVYFGSKLDMQKEQKSISDSGMMFATLSKIAGQVKDSDTYLRSRYESPDEQGQFRQFSDYFLYYAMPVTSCHFTENEIQTQNGYGYCVAFLTVKEM